MGRARGPAHPGRDLTLPFAKAECKKGISMEIAQSLRKTAAGRPAPGLGRWADVPGVRGVSSPEEAADLADRLCPEPEELSKQR